MSVGTAYAMEIGIGRTVFFLNEELKFGNGVLSIHGVSR